MSMSLEKGNDLNSIPPIHPGRAMAEVLMPQRRMSLEAVSEKANLSVSWLSAFAEGRADMTWDAQKKLKSAFGEAARTLYRMQRTYSYFQTHGHRPPVNRFP